MGSDWVPFDPMRYGTREIYWLSDLTIGENTANGITFGDTQAAIDRAMDTWNTVTCANIPLVKVSDLGMDWGVVHFLDGYGGLLGWLADITHAGWLPKAFFEDALGPSQVPL